MEQARELRKKQTSAEEILWQLLRNRQLADLKFRRQHQIGNYIVDFFCAEHNLVVELDGNVHDSPDRRKIDAKRDAYLRSLGHTVVRFPNARVFEDTQRVLQEIIEAVPETRKSGSPRPLGEGQGEGPKDGEGLPGNMTSDHRGARYRDTVLFVDARHIYRQIDRAHRDWTESAKSVFSPTSSASIAAKTSTSHWVAMRRRIRSSRSSPHNLHSTLRATLSQWERTKRRRIHPLAPLRYRPET